MLGLSALSASFSTPSRWLQRVRKVRFLLVAATNRPFRSLIHEGNRLEGALMAADERDLVRRCQRGEAGAFEQFCAYGDLIYRFSYRLCGQAADAEDLTQEVVLAAYEGLGRFAGRSSLRTWLYGIALNQWKHLRGPLHRESVPLEEIDTAVTTSDPALGRMSSSH